MYISHRLKHTREIKGAKIHQTFNAMQLKNAKIILNIFDFTSFFAILFSLFFTNMILSLDSLTYFKRFVSEPSLAQIF